MTDYTPGPWGVEWAVNKPVFYIRTPGGYGICERPSCGDVDTPVRRVSEANARLIAAAPDLLAALEDVQRAYQEMFDVMPVAWQTYDDIVCAAIAKARGEA